MAKSNTDFAEMWGDDVVAPANDETAAPAKNYNLSEKQQAFVSEYVKDFNGTKAATRAGYSENSAHVTASVLLSEPKVRAAVNDALNERKRLYPDVIQRIISELQKIAFANPVDMLSWDGEKFLVNGSDELTDEMRASISGITFKPGKYGDTIDVKQYDKVRAIELLGKMVGAVTDRVEHTHTGKVDVNLTPDEAYRKMLSGDAK